MLLLHRHRPQKLPWGSNEWDWRCVALKERILLLIRELYREGYRHFITGMALGIDTYCCEMVLRLKEEHNDVVLEAAPALPGPGQELEPEEQEALSPPGGSV